MTQPPMTTTVGTELKLASRLLACALLACVPVGPGFGQAQATRGPYLQSLLADSVKVLWFTAEPSVGKVRIHPEGGGQDEVVENAPGTRHEVLITGLSPSTSYRYEVLQGDTLIASGDDFQFHTPPPPGHGSFRAVLVGDSGDPNLAGENFQHEVTLLMESLNPDLFLHVGDYVYTGTLDQVFFQEYRRLLARTGVFPARGNHEGISPQEWYDAFSPPPLPASVSACALPPAVCDENPPQAPPPLSEKTSVVYAFDWRPGDFS